MPLNLLLIKKNQQLHAWSAISRGCLAIDPVMEKSWRFWAAILLVLKRSVTGYSNPYVSQILDPNLNN